MSSKEFFNKQVSVTWVISTVFAALIGLGGTLVSFSAQWTKLNDKLDQLLEQEAKTARRAEIRDGRIDTIVATQDARIAATERTTDKHEIRIDNLERVMGLKIPLRK